MNALEQINEFRVMRTPWNTQYKTADKNVSCFSRLACE